MLTIINTVIAGGLLGALGQGVRIAVGLKKFNEENTANASSNKPVEEFSISRMVISIFIGFVAGALGMIVKGYGQEPDKDLKTETIITIIAIGYSGADFIEGVFNTYIKKVIPVVSANDSAVNPSASASDKELPLTLPDEANFSNNPAQG